MRRCAIPGAYKRTTDKHRGKAGRWTAWYHDAGGVRRTRAGFTDKAATEALARQLDDDARKVRDGTLDPRAERIKAALREPLLKHVGDYRDYLVAKGGTIDHADDIRSVLSRLFLQARIRSLPDLRLDAVQSALGRLRATRSARTANHARGAVRAFSRWLADVERIERPVAGLSTTGNYNEEADRRLVRRALTWDEVGRLMEAAAAAPPVVTRRDGRGGPVAAEMSGPDRAALYLTAMATGYRREELASLTPESFRLDGDAPSVVVAAADTKNGRGAAQPIRRDVAALLAPFVAGREPGVPVFQLPEKTARMLRGDLERAGIPHRTPEGVCDFHGIRAAYITSLVNEGHNARIVQILARHSDIRLTMEKYYKATDRDVRAAIENDGKTRQNKPSTDGNP